MVTFGKGPALRDACPWLRDSSERHRRILDVTERDSVIEGLPPFREETRLRIAERLAAMDRAFRAQGLPE
jgi:hypothetical protein